MVITTDFPLLTSPREGQPDLEERDYYGLNTELAIDFEDIIAEHETFHTYECVWSNSYKCFNICFALWYTLNTLCCSFCAVLYLASDLASTYFLQIWCVTPCFKAMECHCRLKHICDVFGKCTIKPCIELASKHFSKKPSCS